MPIYEVVCLVEAPDEDTALATIEDVEYVHSVTSVQEAGYEGRFDDSEDVLAEESIAGWTCLYTSTEDPDDPDDGWDDDV